MRIPEKIKIHLQRLLNNFLPHYSNLSHRTLRVDVSCPLWKKAPEDMDHLLWSCEALKKGWASLQIQTAPTNSSSSCKNIFVNTFCIADEQSKHLIAISI